MPIARTTAASHLILSTLLLLLLGSLAHASDQGEPATLGEPRFAKLAVSGFDTLATLTGVTNGVITLGDYDNDGDLDLATFGATGTNPLLTPSSSIYRNDGGTYSELGVVLPDLTRADADWGDFDRDGDLDLVVIGLDSTPTPRAFILQNTGTSFVDISAGLTPVSDGSAQWIDYDNDGDLDILLTGFDALNAASTQLYRNDSPGFQPVTSALPDIGASVVAWADFDNDGDQDCLFSGNTLSGKVADLYRNDGGWFTAMNSGLPLWSAGSADWSDYDGDGDPDLVYCGADSNTTPFCDVFRNDAGTFVAIGATITPVFWSSSRWGDYDNDGDPDLLNSGTWGLIGGRTNLYRNDAGTLVDTASGLPDAYYSSAAWADHDNDGDLDFALAGYHYDGVDWSAISLLYSNLAPTTNSTPSPPTGMSATTIGNEILFSWSPGSDAETPTAALTYNLRVGSTPGGSEILSAESASNGFRKIPRGGNAGQSLTWTLRLPTNVTYYWSVQSVDGAFAGSTFSPEKAHLNVTPFADSGLALTGFSESAMAWGDYDNDDDLDLVVLGSSVGGSGALTILYKNDAGGLVPQTTSLQDLSEGYADWGDYDNDGDLDLLLAGRTPGALAFATIYSNSNGVFTDISAGLIGMTSASGGWGDYDNDGDLDIVLSGWSSGNVPATRIYVNDSGTFTPSATLPQLAGGAAAWGDYDADGDLDLVLSGVGGNSVLDDTWIYTNNNGVLNPIQPNIWQRMFNGDIRWGDYDNDGDLDLLISGKSAPSQTQTRIWRNDAGQFVEVNPSIANLSDSDAEWIDYDNDGDLDILLAGREGLDQVFYLYSNDAGSFTSVPAPVPGFMPWTFAVADFDNDGDEDLAFSGRGNFDYVTKLYLNQSPVSNTSPTTPTGLAVHPFGDRVLISWEPAGDVETPAGSLSYDLRIGTTPGGAELSGLEASPANGTRRVVRAGRAGASLSYSAPVLAGASIYVSVQSVDGGHRGSPFSSEVEYRSVYVALATSIPGYSNAAIDWGDYDGDGDLDLAISGADSLGGLHLQVLRNDAGSFVDIGGSFVGVSHGSVDWGDYENDGDLDLVVTGYDGVGYVGVVYRNDAGVFVDIGTTLPEGADGDARWGDYNNDGRLDLVITGFSLPSGSFSNIYRGGPGTFTDIGADLPLGAAISVDWGDYDNDGDLDLVMNGLFGTPGGSAPRLRVMRNDAGVFNGVTVDLTGPTYGNCEWGDYDNDGDLDILTNGADSGPGYVYRNDAGTFVDIGASLPSTPQSGSSGHWGDYDNDGDLDILLTLDSQQDFGTIYRNDAGIFVPGGFAQARGEAGDSIWGDYDGDGDLDILTVGNDGGELISELLVNTTTNSNTPPTAPNNLNVSNIGDVFTFSWDPGTDAETPASGLSYNLRVGTAPGNVDIMSPAADVGSGLRSLVGLGNAGSMNSWSIRVPGTSVLYWSVQAIDTGFAGSAFAAENWRTQPFSELALGLPALQSAAIAWGDYDNDGDPDLAISGDWLEPFPATEKISRIYRNDGGAFVDILAGLTGVLDASMAWGDYDNDGDLDLVVSGLEVGGASTRIYRNDAGTFVDIAAALPGSYLGVTLWGDYDNDGDLDLLLSGSGLAVNGATILYRNDAGSFVEVAAGLPAANCQGADWADYDGDRDLDLVLSGYTTVQSITQVLRNDAGMFTDIGAGLIGLRHGDVAWGDYDGDGDPDIVVVGSAGVSGTAAVYRNDSGVFVKAQATLPPVWTGEVAWGDYDNDGDLDIFLAGKTVDDPVSQIIPNNDGIFGGGDVLLNTAVWGGGAMEVADFDLDGDLDMLTAGTGAFFSVPIFVNEATTANTSPNPPTNPRLVSVSGRPRFTWDAGSDAESNAGQLTYSLRVGSTPDGDEYFSAMALTNTGSPLRPHQGNVGGSTSWELSTSPPIPFYWSVQSVDSGFRGSPFVSKYVPTGVEDGGSIPLRLALRGNYPNPFNPATEIHYDVPAGGADVELKIYDTKGRLVRTLVSEHRPAGQYRAVWDGIDDNRHQAASGVYFCRLTAAGHEDVIRMALVK